MQDLVVILRNGLNQLSVKSFRLFLKIRRDLFCNVLRANGLVVPHDGLHLDQIHYTFELIFLSDGDLNRDRSGIEALAESIDGMLEIGTHLIDLVNETNARDAVLIGLTPY